jgi:thiamine pyrophosphokinase
LQQPSSRQDGFHFPARRIRWKEPDMSSKRALIFTNGTLPDRESARSLIDPADILIAADGGARHILAFDLVPSVIIGDLDSLVKDDRQRLESVGTTIVPFPRDKNETDLELALTYAHQAGFSPILIVAALGGRLDQTLGNLSLLANPGLAGLDISIDDGVEQAFFTRDRAEWRGMPGDLVSLLPWGGEVNGVSTRGLKWPLRAETLYPHKTRGISNEMLENTASVEIRSGFLLIVHRRD